MSKKSKIEKHRQASRNWRKENPEHVSAYNAEYYEAHKEFLKAMRRKWYQEHKAEILARKKAKYELDKIAKSKDE